MERLDLPEIKGVPFEKKWLSMDDYLAFVDFNMRYTVDIKAAREWKRKLAVNAPFKLKK